ncbi:hypothetical protein NKG94_06000 [Micromonospora sp. M12]
MECGVAPGDIRACTQNDKGTYHLSDLPMPADYPQWPSGEQVQRYLESYVEKFGLAPRCACPPRSPPPNLSTTRPGG